MERRSINSLNSCKTKIIFFCGKASLVQIVLGIGNRSNVKCSECCVCPFFSNYFFSVNEKTSQPSFIQRDKKELEKKNNQLKNLKSFS